MFGMAKYNADADQAAMARRLRLNSVIERAQNPLEANLTKDEAILLLMARLHEEYDNLVATELPVWKLSAAVARAK